ncbi:MAG: hypothetical protein GC134_07205 [Proteobacteria bacterium]|nr:hypothetical protein [Pseudomonadota bacterium]
MTHLLSFIRFCGFFRLRDTRLPGFAPLHFFKGMQTMYVDIVKTAGILDKLAKVGFKPTGDVFVSYCADDLATTIGGLCRSAVTTVHFERRDGKSVVTRIDRCIDGEWLELAKVTINGDSTFQLGVAVEPTTDTFKAFLYTANSL